MSKEDDIKLLTEYLLTLLSETNERGEIKQITPTEAAQKTMRELKEAFGVEADVIRQIIIRANEIKRERTDYTVSKPLWEEYGKLGGENI